MSDARRDALVAAYERWVGRLAEIDGSQRATGRNGGEDE